MMDVDYCLNADTPFQQALFVQAQVISKNEEGCFAIVDAGLKAMSIDSGAPRVAAPYDCFEYVFKGDEHGQLALRQGLSAEALATAKELMETVEIGQKLLLLPCHCDPTVNMYDTLVAVRGGLVAHEWPITARGPGL